jgi:hypothetical protein
MIAVSSWPDRDDAEGDDGDATLAIIFLGKCNSIAHWRRDSHGYSRAVAKKDVKCNPGPNKHRKPNPHGKSSKPAADRGAFCNQERLLFQFAPKRVVLRLAKDYLRLSFEQDKPDDRKPLDWQPFAHVT